MGVTYAGFAAATGDQCALQRITGVPLGPEASATAYTPQSGTLSPMPDPSDDDVYDEDGVDRSLIRWFLSLTPLERLAHLDDAMRLAELAKESRDSSA